MVNATTHSYWQKATERDISPPENPNTLFAPCDADAYPYPRRDDPLNPSKTNVKERNPQATSTQKITPRPFKPLRWR